MSLRMRQSLAQLEQEFHHETRRDRDRRDRLHRQAVRRTRVRAVQRRKKRGSMRYAVLVLSMILTAIVVTVGMFASLYLLLS
jgi:hypothetical protein